MKRPTTVAIIAFLLLGTFCVWVLANFDWDPMMFVLEGPDGPRTEEVWWVGYDGRFAYQIASDPLGAVDELDFPTYRYQRIVFPLVVWISSLGIPSLVPWVMIVWCVIAAAASAGLLGVLLARRGTNPWWAMLLLLSFNYLIGVRLVLLEPFAMLLVLGALLAYERDHFPLAITLFALAGLTKEVTLVFPAAIGFWELWTRHWPRAGALLLGVITPYLAWAAVLKAWLGQPTLGNGVVTLTLIPFAGLLQPMGFETRLIELIWVALPALAAGLYALVHFFQVQQPDRRLETLYVLANAVLVATMPLEAWIDPVAVMRIGVGLLLSLMILVAGRNPRRLAYLGGLWGPSILLGLLMPGFIR